MHFFVMKSKTLKLLFLFILVMIMLSIDVYGTTGAQVFFGSVDRKIPIYSVETTEKKIAISFDAAWGADKTEKIMEILKEHNCDATFFLVGFWVDKYPDLVKKIDENGFEIGTHSNTHPDMAKLSIENIRLELETSKSKIEKITGKTVELFRAPFGSYNNNLLTIAEELGLYTIQWDVDSLDWKGGSGAQITSNIISKVKPGSIILCHNNSDHIIDALPGVLSSLKQRGYKFVGIDELIYKNEFSIDSTGKQIKNI